IDDAAAELSERLVGEGLPRAVQSAIAEIVHDTSIVIDEMIVRYRITEIAGDPEHVRVRIQRSYRATNYSRRDINYKALLAEEHFHFPRFISLHCDSGAAGSVSSLDDFALEKRVRTADGSQVKSVEGDPVPLKPIRTDESRARCSVRWEYELTTPRSYS